MLNAMMEDESESCVDVLIFLVVGHVACDHDLRKEIRILVNVFCFPA